MSDDSLNEQQLPPDLKDWPIDPTTLLGVNSETSRQEVRRAYVRLIRRYKPEHAPDEFRRIRTAFEQLDREAEWREIQERSFVSDNDDEDHEEDESGEVTYPVSPFSILDRAQGFDRSDPEGMYAKLLELSRQRLLRANHYIKLFELLSLDRQLDPDRDPCTWLIDGIRHLGTSGLLYDLLESEVHRRDGRLPEILNRELILSPVPAICLPPLTRLRWYVARQLKQFDVIDSDLEVIRYRLLDDWGLWLQVISIGIRFTMLSPAAKTFERLRQELPSVQMASDDWFWDAAEFEFSLQTAWHLALADRIREPLGKSGDFESLIQVVELTWECPAGEAHQHLLEFCSEIMEAPQRKYEIFTQIERTASSFLRRINELIREDLASRDIYDMHDLTSDLEDQLRQFMYENFRHYGQNGRSRSLAFCLLHRVTPYDMSAIVDQLPEPFPLQFISICKDHQRDLSLNLIIRAHRMVEQENEDGRNEKDKS